jgi:hypothetical protein
MHSHKGINGEPHEVPPITAPNLNAAIQRHAQALVKANCNAEGILSINPMQLMCDLALAQTRIEVLFEVIVDYVGPEPKDLVERLCKKLDAEVEQFKAAPAVQVFTGNVPRNG